MDASAQSHFRVRHIKDTLDEDDIQDALSVYNPMEGFSRWKAQQAKVANQ